MTYAESLTDVGLTEFQKKLAFLDAGLTGKGNEVFQTARSQAADTADLETISYQGFHDAYYLSDGGYSRICISEQSILDRRIKIFLTSNSREEVKAAWSRCSELVADCEKIIQETLDRLWAIEDAKSEPIDLSNRRYSIIKGTP